jgi:hypothetical protein
VVVRLPSRQAKTKQGRTRVRGVVVRVFVWERVPGLVGAELVQAAVVQRLLGLVLKVVRERMGLLLA